MIFRSHHAYAILFALAASACTSNNSANQQQANAARAQRENEIKDCATVTVRSFTSDKISQANRAPNELLNINGSASPSAAIPSERHMSAKVIRERNGTYTAAFRLDYMSIRGQAGSLFFGSNVGMNSLVLQYPNGIKPIAGRPPLTEAQQEGLTKAVNRNIADFRRCLLDMPSP